MPHPGQTDKRTADSPRGSSVKKAALYDRAERMYIAERHTFAEIAATLACGEKTIRNWAAEGKWSEKRARFLAQQESLDEKLHDFVHQLMDKVQTDWRDGNQVDVGRLYAITKIVQMLDKAHKYEQATAGTDTGAQQEQTGLSPEKIAELERQLKLM